MSDATGVSVRPRTDRAIESGMDSCITQTDLGIGPCTVVNGVLMWHTHLRLACTEACLETGLSPCDSPSADARSVVDAVEAIAPGASASLFANARDCPHIQML